MGEFHVGMPLVCTRAFNIRTRGSIYHVTRIEGSAIYVTNDVTTPTYSVDTDIHVKFIKLSDFPEKIQMLSTLTGKVPQYALREAEGW